MKINVGDFIYKEWFNKKEKLIYKITSIDGKINGIIIFSTFSLCFSEGETVENICKDTDGSFRIVKKLSKEEVFMEML